MEELQVIETTSGRQFKPWASREDVQAIKQETVQAVGQAVQDPASITAVASEIASGKQAIASAINAKGGEASATESFNKLAQDIQSMEIQQVTIDGGQMYSNQMTGDGVLWDLYTILVQMKSQFMVNGYSYNGVFYKYSALIVCEYYKGYDSLVLQGADAYFTCDGDFYNYASPNHIWHDSDNGKMNRWVCFLFTDEGAGLDIINTAISPRSMYIGGHIGTIEYFVDGRLTEFVCGVEETDVVDNFINNQHTQAWVNNNFVLRNVKITPNVYPVTQGLNTQTIETPANGFVYMKPVTQGKEGKIGCPLLTAQYARDVYMEEVANLNFYVISGIVRVGSNINTVTLRRLSNLSRDASGGGCGSLILTNVEPSPIQVIDIADTDNIPSGLHIIYYQFGSSWRWGTYPDLKDIIVGAFVTNLRCNFWNPTNVLADPDKTATLIDNIKNHILARVSDATGGTQLVFTVSTNLYNAIANENIEWHGETMTLADAFLTKNWLFAGA